MARQKHYIENYNEKDRQAYLFLNNTRHCTNDQLKTFISQNRINSYLKEKLIERIQTAQNDYYKLTNSGYKIFEKQFVRENYKYHSQSPEHDKILSDYYIFLYNYCTADKFEWKNEEDLKQSRDVQYKQLILEREYDRSEMLRTSSVPDCVVSFEDGTSSAYDAITSNYSQTQIDLKQQYADALQIRLVTDKILRR